MTKGERVSRASEYRRMGHRRAGRLLRMDGRFHRVREGRDMAGVGARNMRNFSLLKRAGQARSAILLKRGMSATLEEFLLAAE